MREYNITNNLNYNIIICDNLNYNLKNLIKKSKIIINLHYSDNIFLNLLKINELLSYNCKILYEKSVKNEDLELLYDKVISFFLLLKMI